LVLRNGLWVNNKIFVKFEWAYNVNQKKIKIWKVIKSTKMAKIRKFFPVRAMYGHWDDVSIKKKPQKIIFALNQRHIIYYFSYNKFSLKGGHIKSFVPRLQLLVHKQYIFFCREFFHLQFLFETLYSTTNKKRDIHSKALFFCIDSFLAIYCKNSCLYTIQMAFS